MSAHPPAPLEYETPPQRRRSRLLIIVPLLLAIMLVPIIGIALPWIRRSRDGGNRMRCPSNLRQIGQAMLLYDNDYGGRYPDQIEGLLVEEIVPEVFVCPSSNDTPAATGSTTQATQVNISVPGHCSYIYCAKGLTTLQSADTIDVFEPLSNHGNVGSNVLFGDGHVEFIQVTQFNKILAELAAGHNPPRPEKLR